MFGGAGVLGGF